MPKDIPGVMKEFKGDQLHSGSSSGPVVKSRKQAVAIALSEQREQAKEGPMEKSRQAHASAAKDLGKHMKSYAAKKAAADGPEEGAEGGDEFGMDDGAGGAEANAEPALMAQQKGAVRKADKTVGKKGA